MACEECGHHDEEEDTCEGQHNEQSRVHAYECIYGKEREGLCWLSPGEEPDEAVLENECYANTCIEAAEV